MQNKLAFLLIPPIGYIGLWILGSVLFLIYFQIFGISMDLEYTAMIQRIPVLLSILTVPLCSFLSFFVTGKMVFKRLVPSISSTTVVQVGITSLIFTILFDLLITVAIEKIDILAFPVNLMYLLAWVVIIPAIFLAYRPK